MKTTKIRAIVVLALGLMLWPAETTKGDAEWTGVPGAVYNTTLTDYIGIGTAIPQDKLHVYGGNFEGRAGKWHGQLYGDRLFRWIPCTGCLLLQEQRFKGITSRP